MCQIERMFARLTEYVSAPGFRGCPYANAATALPYSRHPARIAIKDVKDQRRAWFQERLKEAGADRHDGLAEELAVIFDGALVASNVRMSRAPALAAQQLVRRLLAEAAVCRAERHRVA